MTEPIYRDVVERAIAGRGLSILGEFVNNCFLVGDEHSVPTPSPAAFNVTVIVKPKDDQPPAFLWVCDRVFVEFRDTTVMVGAGQSFTYNLADPNSIKQIGDTIVSELANMRKIMAESGPLTELKTTKIGDTTVHTMSDES